MYFLECLDKLINYLTGTGINNTSSSANPLKPFSSSPLTPMAPGANNASASNSQTIQSNSVTSSNVDRYAALKDLDEEFKSQSKS